MKSDIARHHVSLGFAISILLAGASGILGCGGGGDGDGDGPVGLTAWIESGPAVAGGTTQASVMISDPTAVAGLDVDLTFDANSVGVLSVSKSALTNSFVMLYNDHPAGSLAVSMADATGLPGGTGELLEIVFEVDPGVASGTHIPVMVDSLRVYDDAPSEITLSQVSDGVIEVQ